MTAMNSYSISNAVYSVGEVTFTLGSNPGFVIGSEFTVSGVSPRASIRPMSRSPEHPEQRLSATRLPGPYSFRRR